MPRKRRVPQNPQAYYDPNPTNSMSFVAITERRVDSKGKPFTATTNMRPEPGQGYDILTDDVLGSGNLGLLYQFMIDHAAELEDENNLPAKRYLEARIRTAEKLAEIEKKTKKDAALGKQPPKLEPETDAQGFAGFSGLPYPVQSSSNGCWSCAYSLLLKSRGVDLTQEEVRAWRPDYPADTPENEKSDYSRRAVMNTDSSNAIFPNSDLVAKVLPNTAVNRLKVEPFPEYGIGGMSREEQEQIRKVYREQAKQLLHSTIKDALLTHRSPVAIVWDGHYVSITGIKEDGTVRIQDSLATHEPETTMTLDQLAEQGLFEHDNFGNGLHHPEGGGMELVWLSDLPVPEYGSEEPTQLDPENQKYAQLDQNGNVTVNVPLTDRMTSSEGVKSQGQVDVAGVTNNLLLDQSGLKKKLVAFGWNEGFAIAQKSRYYPKRMTQLGDPQVAREQFKPYASELFDAADWMGVKDDDLLTTPEERKAFEACAKQLKPYQEAFSLLHKVSGGNASEEEKKKLPQALKTLKGAGSALLDRAPGNELSNLAIIEQARGKKTAEKLVQTLDKLGGIMDIGFKAKTAEKQLAADRAKAKDITYPDILKGIWESGLANVDKTGPDAERQRRLCIARLIAANFLYDKEKKAGTETPQLPKEQIDNLALKIARTEAFRKMTADGRSSEMLRQNQNKNDAIEKVFIPTLTKYENERVTQEEKTKSYAIAEKRIERVRARTKYLYDKLNKTASGRIDILGLGSVSRRKNSPEFEAAKKAILDFSDPNKPTPTAAEVKNAADTVLHYLDGKEKVRYNESGRERWYQCMCFLAEVMPREDFEKYCDHVNKARGVKPDSDDYVGRENFYPDHSTANFIIGNSIKNILNDEKNSERDLARILATRETVTDGTAVLLDDTFKNEGSRADLRKQTDAIMADPRFQEFARKALWETPRKDLHALLGEKGNGLESAWKKHKEIHPIEKANEKAEAKPVKGMEKT